MIPRMKNEKVRIGKQYNYDDKKIYGWTNMDFDTLYMVINMDLENSMFTVGDVILRQLKGIPMGSPISPILAIMVCAYYESSFYKNCNSDERQRTEGVRYVDDIIVYGIYNRKIVGDKDKTMRVMDSFENCYHEDLILEEEKVVDGQCIFLEAEIKLDYKNKILMRFKNVNWKYIMNGERRKIMRYVHWRSYTPRSIKRCTIIGCIHRIIMHSSCDVFMRDSILKLFFELRSLEYPWKFLAGVMYDMMNKYREYGDVMYRLCAIVDEIVMFMRC
jgi:hypothetical protein